MIGIKKLKLYLIGLAGGFVNGILGTGGGCVIVPLTEFMGVDVKKSHSTAIAVILPITAVSSVFYLLRGNTDLKTTFVISVSGCAGAVFGAKFLKKIPSGYLKILFGISMVAGGIRGIL